MDLKPLVRQALDVATGEVRAYLSQTWEDGKVFDYILLTGGGILAIGDRLRAIFPNAIELPDPVTANPRGLAKFAQRFGVLEPYPSPIRLPETSQLGIRFPRNPVKVIHVTPSSQGKAGLLHQVMAAAKPRPAMSFDI